jgi:3-hydroxybutyryl-CoA dehydrogenase
MKNIVTLGAGRMGRGIAQVFAYAGYPVTMLDMKERSTEDATKLHKSAVEEIRSNLTFLAAEGVFDAAEISMIVGRIAFAPVGDAEDLLTDADVIFEGVPEVLEVKKAALDIASRYASADAIIASTTSTILVESLAGFVTNPERFLNAHWLNPAFLIPLVEVSPGERTAEKTTATLMAILESVGKVPIRCKAAPGYIVPRIQALAMNEAARIVEEGVATAEDVDRAIRVGFGPRFASMGLLEFIDWGGGDILYYASNYMTKALDAERFAPPDVVVENMDKGHIGLSAGKGFYDFEAMDVDAYRKETLARFVGLIRHLGHLPKPGESKN